MRLRDIPMWRKLIAVGALVATTSIVTQTYEQLSGGLCENKQQQLAGYFAQQQSDLAVTVKTIESFQRVS